MLICKQFCYAHIPRTAGDYTAAALWGAVPRSDVIRRIKIRNSKKHDAPHEQGISENKQLVLSVRRLAPWLLSYVNMLCQCGVHPTFEKRPWPSAVDISDIESSYKIGPVTSPCLSGPLATIPDRYLHHMLSGRCASDIWWLRCENIAEDVADLVGQFWPERAQLVRPFWVKGKVKLKYDHDISTWGWDIRQLYKNNPLWSEVERAVYDL